MAKPKEEIPAIVLKTGAVVAIGWASMKSIDSTTEEAEVTVKSLWPDELSADALYVAEQVVLLLTAAFGLDPVALFELSTVALETTERTTTNGE